MHADGFNDILEEFRAASMASSLYAGSCGAFCLPLPRDGELDDPIIKSFERSIVRLNRGTSKQYCLDTQSAVFQESSMNKLHIPTLGAYGHSGS